MTAPLVSLDGDWKLFFAPETGSLPGNPHELKQARWRSIPATVPGNVELDLHRAGIEEDPFFGDHIYEFRKYESYQWWFEREFDFRAGPSGTRDIFLHLEGIDTYSTIWLNGIEIGHTDNMLIEHDFKITPALREGSNTITIRIESAIRKALYREYPAVLFGGEGHDEICWLRKPAHCFGWDIAPRFPSAGIWRSISIVRIPPSRFLELYFATKAVEDHAAVVMAAVRFRSDEFHADGFSLRMEGRCRDQRFSLERELPFVSQSFPIVIENPRLWYPRGYGDPDLYTVVTQLFKDGKPVDSRKDLIGIRSVEVETEYGTAGPGKFQIWVNHAPVMVLGTNWVPLDAFHSRDRSRLGRAFRLLEDLNCNMIRCWGGNVYEHDALYRLCDRNGVMVWQDFAFACSSYPHAEEFLATVRKEAACVVRRLRNHPALVLWTGDNEVDQDFIKRGYLSAHVRHNVISREILPGCVRDHDPFRMYLPSSPFIPENSSPNQYTVPEQHLWGPRAYYMGDFYRHSSASFISEVGYHGCPSLSSLRTFLSKENVWPRGNSQWTTHSTEYRGLEYRRGDRIELMAKQVEMMFGSVPDRIEDFILASQISQAEALKFFVEMVRLRKWRRTGILWWNLLDCWPQISDAVVDYYFRKKLAYHYLKRIQQRLCVTMNGLDEWRHEILIDSSIPEDAPVLLSVRDGETDEPVHAWQGIARANSNTRIGTVESVPGRQRLYILEWESRGSSFANHYVSGFVPYELERYKVWLGRIARLPPAFCPEECFR